MTDASNRRESMTQRCDFMREIVDQVVGLDTESIFAKVGSSEREHLSNPRFSGRLAMRYARGIIPEGLFVENADSREVSIVRGGSETVALIAAMAGTHVLWQEVIRLVRREDREDLDLDLGISTRSVALRGRQHNFDFAVTNDKSDHEMKDIRVLAERIRKEGALCWGCWLATRDTISARRLRVLTPARVSRFIMGVVPGTAEERGFRRLAVDLEIDELLKIGIDETFEQGDA